MPVGRVAASIDHANLLTCNLPTCDLPTCQLATRLGTPEYVDEGPQVGQGPQVVHEGAPRLPAAGQEEDVAALEHDVVLRVSPGHQRAEVDLPPLLAAADQLRRADVYPALVERGQRLGRALRQEVAQGLPRAERPRPRVRDRADQ